MTDVVAIIPARWGSSRFEGKPLTARLTAANGRSEPLLWWTYQAALAALPAACVWVATDDARILKAAEGFGAQAILTSPTCRNGTERVQEAAMKLELTPTTLVLNVQGDAPLTPPGFILALIDAMTKHPDLPVATPALRCDRQTLSRLRDQRQRGLVGGTTLVRDRHGRALYFSKEVIPYADALDLTQDGPLPIFHHVGLYAYRRPALDSYVRLDPGPLEILEGLEQLRFLENGIPVQCVDVEAEGHGFWEVNNPEDVALVSAHLGHP